jgi:hypothetical protein
VTLYITPVYYVYLDLLQTKLRSRTGGRKPQARTDDRLNEVALAGRDD